MLVGNKGVLEGKIVPLVESMEKYKKVLGASTGDKVLCPYCKSEKDRDHILKEIELLMAAKRNIESQITTVSQEISNENKNESDFYSKEDSLQKLIGTEGKTFMEISKYEAAVKNIEGIKDRAKSLKQSYSVSKGVDISELKNKLNELEETSKSIDARFSQEDDKLRTDLNSIVRSISSTNEEILVIDNKISKLNSLINSYYESSKSLFGEYKTLELRLSGLKQIKTNLESAKKELEEQRLIQSRVAILEELFGSDGIRTKIADIYVPIFNRHLTDFVTILTAGRMHVQLERGSLEPKITGASSSNYEMLSGGEQDVIRLAANLALGMVSLGSSRSLPETLFLDEVFGSLAPAMQDRVFDLLRHLRGYFSRIMVITHSPMLQERFGRVVCVEKIGGISQIMLGGKQ